jgi:inner membrane protein involved in colicin E2 resistance
LLTTYSAAVLKSWLRARVIGGLLVGLYATLYVLLNLEAYSLLIGSVLLFIALAVVMWATRSIDWGAKREIEGEVTLSPAPSPAPTKPARKVATATSASSD